jgi:hypothetical protein
MSDAVVDAGGDLAERHRERHDGGHRPGGHDRAIAIAEAIMLSVVALLAAWSGYSAASWDTRASDLLAESSELQVAAQARTQEALQIRTFDSVTFDAALDAYLARNQDAFELAIRRMRPQYRRAFRDWLKLRPLQDPSAPADPSRLAQYRIPEEAQGRRLAARAQATYRAAGRAGNDSDGYVRLTVILASVLFLIGISGHFPVRAARYGLIGVGSALILYSLVTMLRLPGPPG